MAEFFFEKLFLTWKAPEIDLSPEESIETMRRLTFTGPEILTTLSPDNQPNLIAAAKRSDAVYDPTFHLSLYAAANRVIGMIR